MASGIRALFLSTKMHAKQRGIKFRFTFEQWTKWWEDHLGHEWPELRGCRRGQYVMARIGDKGCYEPRNVRCISVTDNHREKKLNGNHSHGTKHPRCKLTNDKVLAIRQSRKESKELATIYGVSPITIRDIRAGRRWRHL